jgi:hypothetical protein
MRRRLVAQQTKHTAMKSEKLQIELDVLKKSLIPVDEVERDLDMAIIAARTSLLSLPQRVAVQVVHTVETMSDPHVKHLRVCTILDAAIREALEHLAGVNVDPQWAERMDRAVHVALEMMGHEQTDNH